MTSTQAQTGKTKATSRRHEMVAFERGTYGDQGQAKGYAARCDTCGAVTFGGFRTKTDRSKIRARARG